MSLFQFSHQPPLVGGHWSVQFLPQRNQQSSHCNRAIIIIFFLIVQVFAHLKKKSQLILIGQSPALFRGPFCSITSRPCAFFHICPNNNNKVYYVPHHHHYYQLNIIICPFGREKLALTRRNHKKATMSSGVFASLTSFTKLPVPVHHS